MSKWTDKWDLRGASLGNRILYVHKNKRFMQDMTIAERGYGKSMYQLQTMAYVYYHLIDKNETDAWNYAIDNLIFRPSQLLERVEYNEEHNITSPVWCIDDAAVHFSNKLWWSDWSEAMLLDGIFDLIRPVLSCLLINCPDKKRLLGSLQHYLGYEESLYIHKNKGYQRNVIGIHWYRRPSGTSRWRKEWEDSFSCYIPDWAFARYTKIRKEYIAVIRKKLKTKHEERMAKEKADK